MKKIQIATAILFVLISVTGCVKDKDFNDNKYGINDPDKSPTGVGFLQGIKYVNPIGLNVSSDAQTISSELTISLLGKVSSSDVHVQLAIDSNIVTAYNSSKASDSTFVPLSALGQDLFSLASREIVIPAGERLGNVAVKIPSTISLNPNLNYGVGLRIVSVDGGLTVATNENEILLQLSIVNFYDGVYELHGQFYHPTAAPGFPTFNANVEMVTTGPNSLEMYWAELGDFAHPWSQVTGGTLTYFTLQSPEYTVNPTDSSITVQNIYPGAVTFYTMGIGYDNAGYSSRWDGASKTMYVNFGYNLGPAGEFIPGTSREWIDTLIYLHAR